MSEGNLRWLLWWWTFPYLITKVLWSCKIINSKITFYFDWLNLQYLHLQTINNLLPLCCCYWLYSSGVVIPVCTPSATFAPCFLCNPYAHLFITPQSCSLPYYPCICCLYAPLCAILFDYRLYLLCNLPLVFLCSLLIPCPYSRLCMSPFLRTGNCLWSLSFEVSQGPPLIWNHPYAVAHLSLFLFPFLP